LAKKQILYFDAMVDPRCGASFYDGVAQALDSSESQNKLELVSVRFNYGERCFSPRLMAELVRDHNASGVILSGSEKNTSETQNTWIKDYLYGLHNMLETFPDLPVFGICFGHQALACLFGGETSRFAYRTGFEEIKPAHQAKFHPVMKQFPSLTLGVTHGDHVIRVPSGFHLLATSDYCDCQALAHDTRPILSLQAHPEITKDILNVSDEKEFWQKYSDADFKTQSGPAFLKAVFAWMDEKSGTTR
jgi:GMP synthase-like glutamine amidotransferase